MPFDKQQGRAAMDSTAEFVWIERMLIKCDYYFLLLFLLFLTGLWAYLSIHLIWDFSIHKFA